MNKRNFTLTELVFVLCMSVAVLTVLISGAGCFGREKARQENCVAKLKQYGLAQFMYSSQNKDYVALPDNFTGEYVSNRIDPTGTTAATTPIGKLLLGGYFGMNLKEITADAKEKVTKCPSDGKYKDSENMSYYNAIFAYDSPTAKKRMIIGRDYPGAAIFFDSHRDLAFANSNHKDIVSVVYLAGHVASLPIEKYYNATSQSGDAWQFLDQR